MGYASGSYRESNRLEIGEKQGHSLMSGNIYVRLWLLADHHPPNDLFHFPPNTGRF